MILDFRSGPQSRIKNHESRMVSLNGGWRMRRQVFSFGASCRPRVSAFLSLVLLIATGAVRLAADEWPEWRGKGRLGGWSEAGILGTFPEGRVTAAWGNAIYPG